MLLPPKDRRSCGQRQNQSRGVTLRNGAARRWGLHPHHQLMYSEPAVGLCIQWATRLLAREVGYGLVDRVSAFSAPRPYFSGLIHVLQPAVAHLLAHNGPTRASPRRFIYSECSPGRQLGFLSRPSNEGKGSDGLILRGCSPNQAVGWSEAQAGLEPADHQGLSLAALPSLRTAPCCQAMATGFEPTSGKAAACLPSRFLSRSDGFRVQAAGAGFKPT